MAKRRTADIELIEYPNVPAPEMRGTRPKKSTREFSEGSESSWGTQGDYRDPSPEYLSRFTEGPIEDEQRTKRQVQRGMERQLNQRRAEERAADKAIEARSKKRAKRTVLRGRKNGRR